MSADRVSELNFGDDIIALAPGDAIVMAVPPRPAAALLPELKTPSKFRAIVNAHFRFDPPTRPAADHRRGRRTGGMAVCVSAAALDHHQQCRPAGRYAARGTGAGDLAGYLQGRRRCRANCRRGRSCASAALRSRRRRSRTPCGRARRPPRKTCFSPATGLIRACRQPSRDRCGRATAPPIWSLPCGGPDRKQRDRFFTATGPNNLKDVERDAFRQSAR